MKQCELVVKGVRCGVKFYSDGGKKYCSEKHQRAAGTQRTRSRNKAARIANAGGPPDTA